MSARQDPRTGKWFYRVRVRDPFGKSLRLFRSPFGTKEEAEEAEAGAIADVKSRTIIVRGRARSGSGDAEKRGVIYFIRADNAIKIGFTFGSAESRLSTLQVANPSLLHLAGWTTGTEADERALHRRFEHLRIRGEWFRLDAELEHYILRVRDR